MNGPFVARRPLAEFGLWDKMAAGRAVFSFDLEVTARCNLDCRHCYINLPAGDRKARRRELGAGEIGRIGREAADLGAVWCLITGGEPLLRKDFFDIYRALAGKGLVLSLFTNATLVSAEHIRFFKKFPPREIEVTVYGNTRETYERVTRTPGSFEAFQRGLARLLGAGLPLRLKAMALRSNKHELAAIGDFCRRRTKDYYRFDPHLHLRFDRDEARNALIRAERLSGREVARLERSDPERFGALRDACGELPAPGPPGGAPVPDCRHIFRCGVGQRSFVVGPEGLFRPCLSLHHPDFLFDLRKGGLAEAWNEFLPRRLTRTSDRPEFLEKCAKCPVVNLCLWCPAHAYLETGELDSPVEAFCRVAEARAEGLKYG
ncbi:MAG TPA: radical SAM protein [Candidatus Aminicenantes bacterium]|nr:radical SAM protein [Candidatus Aminicenantes bacterium]